MSHGEYFHSYVLRRGIMFTSFIYMYEYTYVWIYIWMNIHMNESSRTHKTPRKCKGTHSYARHDSFVCVTGLIRVLATTTTADSRGDETRNSNRNGKWNQQWIILSIFVNQTLQKWPILIHSDFHSINSSLILDLLSKEPHHSRSLCKPNPSKTI